MRQDEEFVKDAIVGTLNRPPDKTIPGGNHPPDYILHFGSTAIALEVRTLSSIYVTRDGTVGNRRTIDEFLFRFNDDLIRTYSSLVPDGQFVMVHYQGPVTKAKAYQKELKALVEGRLSGSGFSTTGLETFEVAGNKVQIRQHAIDHSDRKKIVGLISNKDSIVSIDQQAAYLLEDAISTKTSIIEGLNLPGDKWLGFLNSYFLADAATYRRALQHSQTKHCFSKLFVVSLDGSVEDITT